jgi:hypothetical protein
MDVKIEGQNVVRHMDLTTHNHINNSNAALVLNQAKDKIAAGEPLNCEELDTVNKDEREKRIRPSYPDDDVVTQMASFTPAGGGKSIFMKAMTPQAALASPQNSGYQGPNGKGTMACTEELYGGSRAGPTPGTFIGPRRPGHERANSEFRNHTEAKIIEGLFGSTPPQLGTLKTKISKISCWSCRRAICAAVNCGLTIILCNNEKQEVNAEELCDNGEPEPAGGSEYEIESLWASEGLP